MLNEKEFGLALGVNFGESSSFFDSSSVAENGLAVNPKVLKPNFSSMMLLDMTS